MMCSTSITKNETWELTIKGACGNIYQKCVWFCYIFSIVCPLGLTRPNWPSSRAMISRLTKSWMITCWSVGQIVAIGLNFFLLHAQLFGGLMNWKRYIFVGKLCALIPNWNSKHIGWSLHLDFLLFMAMKIWFATYLGRYVATAKLLPSKNSKGLRRIALCASPCRVVTCLFFRLIRRPGGLVSSHATTRSKPFFKK